MRIRKHKKIPANQRIQLTSKEKSELLVEGIVTIILLLLLNVAILGLSRIAVQENSQLESIIFSFKEVLYQTFFIDSVYSFSKIATFILLIIDVLVLYWRLIRRYHQMQLRHIIRELHYIADNNFDHRIPFKLNGDLGKVVNSVNRLVDSTVQALEEERRIEKSKDELITNISHDIRTPLTSIIGYLGLIEEEKYSNEQELRHYTKTAYNKAKQMKVLVDDLFEYTKIRQPSAPLQLSSFDMCQLLEQLAADFELEAQRRQMVIDVVPPKRPIVMMGDTEKLVRVFNNLISNALKYGKGGKQILLNAEKVGSEVVVTIANDGATIPEKALNQVFERFYRVEASRSQETGGTGLGLAIAQSIIVLHGGYIFVKSENGWTTFVIHLPLEQGNPSNEKKGVSNDV
ncbi:HAMP domain-containing histidine kinase [Vagococcus lutrae]|uniref:sensor histidine kinase n=1 Tax=Vagococcus lutrae TaxID=81947 RepID=UPI00200F0C3C|nr:HAMP domain-containing sensor histidine kinase [Vagococcus lutrae]UQF37974.1 HAMP domain-containing histidine kinase [Vagococcus lutrae]